MPVTKIAFRPGVVRDTTSYSNEGGWYYCDKIRFRSGAPEKIGGWVRVNEEPFLGTCTALMPWATLGGTVYTAVGTNLKYYAEFDTLLYDITPIRDTTAAGDATFTAVNGSATLTVTDVAHGALIGDFVTFSGAVTLGGVITAAVLNIEYQIASIVDVNNYTITASVAADAADVGNGGAAVVAAYQLHVGLAVQVNGTGWGAGGYGEPSWGSGSAATAATQLRVWTQDTFGEDLVFCSRMGQLYYWDSSVGLATRAVYLEDMPGASDVPTVAFGVLVTGSRHVVAFGCNPIGAVDQDPTMVRWSDTEDAVNWTPTATNTAGGQKLATGTIILAMRNTRQETLIWTDLALYSMSFIGGELEFGFTLLGTPVSLVGPNAVSIVSGTAFWMGSDKFYMYNGAVVTLPCNILNVIQNNRNVGQDYQIVAGANEHFGEVTWFYCSTDSERVDSYVTYNYIDNVWFFGTMDRSAWVDATLRSTPLAADNVNNVLVLHEIGADDVSTGTPVAISSYIESSDFDLGDGHQFMFISRVLPDVSFVGSTAGSPSLNLTLKTRNSPGQDWNASANQPSESAITRTASGSIYTSPIEQYTAQAWVRLRGRQAALRIESDGLGVAWQLGSVRLDIRPDGRR